MIRSSIVAAIAASSLAAPLSAQTAATAQTAQTAQTAPASPYVAPVAPPPPPRPASLTTNVLFASEAAVVPMAEWEIPPRDPAAQVAPRILIAAGDAELQRAPPGAVRYDSQTFRFPSGDVRVLRFTQAGGGVLHQITSETQLYVARGSAVVGVAGAPAEIVAGDVVNLPSGVLRSRPGRAEDTTIVAFTVRSTVPDAKAARVRGQDSRATALAGGDKAGLGGTRVTVQRYPFDGNSIRVARLSGRGRTATATPAVDVLLYMLAGQMQITIGDEVRTVAAGDVLREEARKPTHWDVAQPASFVAINAPPLNLPPAAAAPAVVPSAAPSAMAKP